MKPIHIKTSIFLMCAALLTLFAPQQTSAQELFNGVVTYKMSMNGASATTCTVYYRGRDYLTDMPQNKLRTLYLSEERKMYSIMSMMGKPIVSSFDYDVETSSLEIFDETTPTEEIAGHHCLRITTDSDNEMMEGKVTIWIALKRGCRCKGARWRPLASWCRWWREKSMTRCLRCLGKRVPCG